MLITYLMDRLDSWFNLPPRYQQSPTIFIQKSKNTHCSLLRLRSRRETCSCSLGGSCGARGVGRRVLGVHVAVSFPAVVANGGVRLHVTAQGSRAGTRRLVGPGVVTRFAGVLVDAGDVQLGHHGVHGRLDGLSLGGQAPPLPLPVNLVTNGMVMADSATMMPMTTNNSIKVNPPSCLNTVSFALFKNLRIDWPPHCSLLFHLGKLGLSTCGTIPEVTRKSPDGPKGPLERFRMSSRGSQKHYHGYNGLVASVGEPSLSSLVDGEILGRAFNEYSLREAEPLSRLTDRRIFPLTRSTFIPSIANGDLWALLNSLGPRDIQGGQP